jgi:hypothetical protein
LSELQELREQIRSAFPASPFSGTITSCSCDECAYLRNELSPKRWDEVPTDFLDFTCSPNLLGPDAKRAFVPAYMLRALDDLSGDRTVMEFTVYSLCPGDSEWDGRHPELFQGEDGLAELRGLAQGMTTAQIQAIREFLLFVRDKASNGAWLRPFIDSALDKVWSGRPDGVL